MKRLIAMLALTPVFVVGGFASQALAQSSSAAAPAAATYNLSAPVTAAIPAGTTLPDGTTLLNGATFNGTYTLTQFANNNGQLAAVGSVVGQAVDPVTGAVLATVNQTLTSPAQLGGSCTILDLTLGPLHLDLLGLVVDLNQVHLTITAQQGPGNLLGNLLCAVANLLNGGGGGISTALNQIVALLNQILAGL